MDPLEVGDPERVGRYRLRGRLGEGGMGRVYLGSTPEGQQAAIKVIRDDLANDTGFRQRFRREVSAAVAVAGLFTARVLDADPDADPPWLATQYVDGPSLRDLVHKSGPLGEPSLLRLAQGLGEALSAIHAAGLVHRDLKPGNVLLAVDGAKVIDFGIAHASDATKLTGTGQVMGTLEYMAPEQLAANARPGPASDVFAMGATICFAATGRSPFAAEHATGVLYRVLHRDPDLRGLPPRIVAMVRACLEKDPARRPTAPQVAAWLRNGATAPERPAPPLTRPVPGPLPVPVLSAPVPTPAPSRRRGAVIAGVAALAVVLVGGGAALALNPVGQQPPPVPEQPTTSDVASTPKPSTPPTTAASDVDPDSPEARYVERLCSSGDLLVTLADSASSPTTSVDPAVLRRDFLATTDRSIGILDTALADYRVLRDDAPTPEVEAGFQGVIDEFTTARTDFVDARAIVEASDPLTPEAYGAGVDRFGDAAESLSGAAALVEGIRLPPDYTAASASAPSCND